MECPSCYELYDSEEKIPRNLSCGHTYCEFCLTNILQTKKRLICPLCRYEAPQTNVTQLSKNFIAMELSTKQNEIRKKLQICPKHANEPLRIYCKTCNENICFVCVIGHSGHEFCEQKYSVDLVNQKQKDTIAKFQNKLDEVVTLRSNNTTAKDNIQGHKKEKLSEIESYFTHLEELVKNRKEQLQLEFNELCDKEIKACDSEETLLGEIHAKFENGIETMSKILTDFEDKKIIDGENEKKIDDYEEIKSTLGKDIESNLFLRSIHERNLPRVQLEDNIFTDIKNLAAVTTESIIPTITYFGEKNKVLIYDIHADDWEMKTLPANVSLEFHYYCSSVTQPSGDILITGGGLSNDVYMFNPKKFTMKRKASMKKIRKEHSTVMVNGKVYALGGYDGEQARFLSECELYDVTKDEWTVISPMNKAKCAFAATPVNSDTIFACGGYDGENRLRNIELYRISQDRWETLDVLLITSLSNCACSSPKPDTIIILGGGCNQGFSHEVYKLDLKESKFTKLKRMSKGRDLRNKVVNYKGYIFTIGGNSCHTEKFCLRTNSWLPLKEYSSLVNDNLDSWSCSFTMDYPGGNKSPKKDYASGINQPSYLEYPDMNGLPEEGDDYQQYWNRNNYNMLRSDYGFFRNYGNSLDSDDRHDILMQVRDDYDSSDDD